MHWLDLLLNRIFLWIFLFVDKIWLKCFSGDAFISTDKFSLTTELKYDTSIYTYVCPTFFTISFSHSRITNRSPKQNTHTHTKIATDSVKWNNRNTLFVLLTFAFVYFTKKIDFGESQHSYTILLVQILKIDTILFNINVCLSKLCVCKLLF